MTIQEIDNSEVYTKIMICLLNRKIMSAQDIALEYKNPTMHNEYRKKCNELEFKHIVLKHKIPNREGYKYSLNYDKFFEFLGKPYDNSKMKSSLMMFIDSEDFRKLREQEMKIIKKHTYRVFLIIFKAYFMVFTAHNQISKLKQNYYFIKKSDVKSIKRLPVSIKKLLKNYP